MSSKNNNKLNVPEARDAMRVFQQTQGENTLYPTTD